MKKTNYLLLIGLLSIGSFISPLPLHSSEDQFSLCLSNDHSMEEAILFTGSSNIPLAQEIASYLQISLGEASVGKFSDGEIQISLQDNVRNKNVFIIQSNCHTTNQSVNDNIMELFLLVRTAKRASAKTITAVIPYYGYARQDRKMAGRVPISAADIALMLEVAGVDRVVTIDLHYGQIQGFFRDAPVDNLSASFMFISYLEQKNLQNTVVVSPDAGGVERTKKFMDSLIKQDIPAEMAIISKQRAKAGVIASMNLIGDVTGADVIIVDDMCDTGGTLVKAAQLLKDHGANRVFAVVTHPVFSGDALEKIQNSVIDEMLISDTIPIRGDIPSNVRIISIASLIGEAICRVQSGKSISELFQ